jgi:hypothetical protein
MVYHLSRLHRFSKLWGFMKNFLVICLVCLLCLTASIFPVNAVPLPSKAQGINVKAFGAKGDGRTDDTKAIQQALDAASKNKGTGTERNNLVYLPNGTYLISATLSWPSKRIIVSGQTREKTVIKLKDNSPGFSSSNKPLPAITTFEGESTGQAFSNAIYDLTVDIGSGNQGAIGIRFLNNNQGGLRNVAIKSSDRDRRGSVGLALTRAWPGPAMIRDLQISGFDYGIEVQQPEYSLVFEDIALTNQRVAGIKNTANILSIRGLTSKNSVPVIQNVNSDTGMIVVLNGDFKGGSSSFTAIENRGGTLYARNIKTSGYKSAIKNGCKVIRGNNVTEYISGKVYSLFPTPKRSLQLAVEEVPVIPQDDFKDWVSVTDYGANGEDDKDDTAAIQKAMDAGTTVYFPNGKYFISDTIRVRGKVRRITGLHSTFKVNPPLQNQDKPVFRFEEGERNAIILERFWGDYGGGAFHWIEHASSKTLILRNIYMGSGAVYRNTGSGKLFIEDVTGYGNLVFNKQKVWARQLNVEAAATQITNNGGSLWILGLKTEDEGTVVETTNGGKTEILGGLVYPATRKIPDDRPAFINDESKLSVIIRTSYYQGGRYQTVVREKRKGATKKLMYTDIPRIGEINIIPLYAGYE